jgi:outer membrane protein TolC
LKSHAARRLWPAIFCILWLFAACTPKLSPEEAPIPKPEAFNASGEIELPNEWWTSFQDPVLDSLVLKALQENLALAGNWQQYRASLAIVKREKSFLFPQIDFFC